MQTLDAPGAGGPEAASGSAPFPVPGGSSRALLPAYDAYRRRQARAFLALVPREGLRALYGEARAGKQAGQPVCDPVAIIADFVLSALPLPPFHVWCQDVRAHPAAHLDEPWMADFLPDRGSPLALEARSLALQGGDWRAELRVHHAHGGWHGHLAFTHGGEQRTWRTADVFKGPDLEALQTRFREFDQVTLEAFLRSVLP